MHNSTRDSRQITIYHGARIWKKYMKTLEDGTKEMWERPIPAGGVRIINVHPSCRDSSATIAHNLNGYLPNPKDWEDRPYDPFRGVVLLDSQNQGKKTDTKKKKPKLRRRRKKKTA
jgi:hypothetical protein